MARRKKRMKLPNNFGSIKYLGLGRRNPYGVYPPVTEWTAKSPVTPKAIGYKETWEEAYELLTAYNLEKQGKIQINQNIYIDRTPTFAEVYEDFYQEKFFRSEKKLSNATRYSTQSAFRNLSSLHNLRIGQIKYDVLQKVINSCELKHASLELMITLLHQMYAYALKYEIINKNYSQFIYMPKADDDESGVPFSDEELITLWKNSGDLVTNMILIMCYSGYRIKAYTQIEVNLKERYLKGGVKTKASKDRIVPIHSSIFKFVESRYCGNDLLGYPINDFRNLMYKRLSELKIEKHTPHDCRHTFSRLCEKYKVNENDRKRLMGHSFGSDITNAKYGHRTVAELREEIEKIKTPK
jgi:integrase